MKYRIVHTCIRVKDLETSVAFYEEALGFRETRRKDFPGDGFTLVFLTGSDGVHELELTYNVGHPGYEIGNGFSHLAVMTEELLASYEEHRERGYQISELGGLKGSSSGSYFITDPDGYEIEILGPRLV